MALELFKEEIPKSFGLTFSHREEGKIPIVVLFRKEE